ncbi:endo-beta-N-acetylglucosaminidase [Rheinheimera sp.]|uniref:endo-beta-N-acetylglucosaminidase n=1 Tax=Rheinheimera sp. TaxID=1869214 RepID=UPI00307F2492
MRSLFWCCVALCSGLAQPVVSAQPAERTQAAGLQPAEPPFALTLQQLADWTEQGATASAANRSQVPLARRQSAPLDGLTVQDTQAKVLYAPDGMNNFGNYLTPQPQFNLYSFSHWSQIDILNWFAGTADLTVQIPARPWVDTAHKNGVKVIGSVFLGIAQWGGNPDTVEALLQQDSQGRFVLAEQLIRIAEFYGFDGWLVNQETDLTAVKDAANQLVKGQKNPQRGAELATRLLAFMQYLTARAPQGMEIHWYDSMLPSGVVRWQNQLNEQNQRYLQGAVRSSDAMFLNYWWDQPMIRQSAERAVMLGRSPYEVYTGADLWPSRTAQRAFSQTRWLDDLFVDGKALTSIALFAPNVNFNFDGEADTPAFSQFQHQPDDVQRFYQTEQRLFAGDDLNQAVTDASGWKGLGAYLAAKTSLLSLPFQTRFNTGHGKQLWQQGQAGGAPWSDISQQDLLPTWQFAVLGDPGVKLFYDFDRAWSGGSSLAIQRSGSRQPSHSPLFRTALPVSDKTQLKLRVWGQAEGISLYLQTATGQRLTLPLQNSANWQQLIARWPELAGQQLVEIGVVLSAGDTPLDARIGELELLP